MSFQVNGIKLDKNNKEFNNAFELVEKTNSNIYLTGKAGSGKTTFLKYLRQYGNKKMVVLAPTGIAAVNAGGQTIHSFFQIAPSIYVPNDKRLRKHIDPNDDDTDIIYDYFQYRKEKLDLLKNLQLLVIDEVSMVRCDILDVVDKLLRVFRKKNSSFGGVQVLLIGDVFQLAPVARPQEWNILSKFYESSYFFSSKVIENNKLVYVELKKIYRQKDLKFIELLNRVRINKLTEEDYENLNSNYKPGFNAPDKKKYITLSTHNAFVSDHNRTKLSSLSSKLYHFEADITGEFPKKSYPNEKNLQLKTDAQIMFIKNDYGREKKYYNGQIGIVKHVDESKIIIETEVNGNYENIELEKTLWENLKYTWNKQGKKVEEEVLGTFSQYPIKLAWAITVHKSQGLTFENVIADLSEAFAPGQVYVALSRCTTFAGIVLKSKIGNEAVKVDGRVLEFAANKSSDEDIYRLIKEGERNTLFKDFREAVLQEDYDQAFSLLSRVAVFKKGINEKVIKRLFKLYLSKINKYQEINHANKRKKLYPQINQPKTKNKKDKDIVWLDNNNGIFTDPRDGKTYKTVKIGQQVWLAENLCFTEGIAHISKDAEWSRLKNNAEAFCYNENTPENSQISNVLYTYAAALKTSTNGWHLPTKEDFEILLNSQSNDNFEYVFTSLLNGGRTGFNVILEGRRYSVGDFSSEGNITAFWSAEKLNTVRAFCCVFNPKYKKAEVGHIIKENGLNIRLLKD